MGTISSHLGHKWGGEMAYDGSPAARLLAVGKSSGILVEENSIYFGMPVLLENLDLQTGREGDNLDHPFCAVWAAGKTIICKDCSIMAWRGSAVGSDDTVGDVGFGPTFRFALISCSLDSDQGQFAYMHPFSIGRFIGCTVGDHMDWGGTGGNLQLSLFDGEKEECKHLLERRKSFERAPKFSFMSHLRIRCLWLLF